MLLTDFLSINSNLRFKFFFSSSSSIVCWVCVCPGLSIPCFYSRVTPNNLCDGMQCNGLARHIILSVCVCVMLFDSRYVFVCLFVWICVPERILCNCWYRISPIAWCINISYYEMYELGQIRSFFLFRLIRIRLLKDFIFRCDIIHSLCSR